MTLDLRVAHPLVVLGAKLAVTFLLLPTLSLVARFVVGTQRDDALVAEAPGRRSLVLALGAALPAAFLGLDALDPRTVPALVAVNPLARGGVGLLFGLLASLPALTVVRAHRPFPPLTRATRNALAVIAALCMLPLLGLGVLRANSALGEDPLDADTLSRAPLRAALVPADGGAHLALAHLAAARDEVARARAALRVARALGADAARGCEIESELAARAGDCRSAVALFRRALEARVPTEPDAILTTRLTLGGFHLPPSLITRCDFATGERR